MAQKPLKLTKLIPTLILSLGLCSASLLGTSTLHVRALDDPGQQQAQQQKQMWTAVELINQYPNYSSQIIGDCDAGLDRDHDDLAYRASCRLANYQRMYEEDEMFRAYANLRNGDRFQIAGFDPGRGYASPLHFSHTLYDAVTHPNSDYEQQFVTYLSVFWTEDDTMNQYDAALEYFNSKVDMNHRLFYGPYHHPDDADDPSSAYTDGAVRVVGSTYASFDILSPNFHQLVYLLGEDYADPAAHVVPVESCIDNGYQDGMICHAMYSADGFVGFLPTYDPLDGSYTINYELYYELPEYVEPVQPEPEQPEEPEEPVIDPHTPDEYEEFTLPESSYAAANYPYTLTNGHFVWDYLDLMELNKIYQADLDTCGGNTYCEEALQEARMNEHPMYRALMMLRGYGFRFFSVNPSLETITIQYDDATDYWARRYHYENDFTLSEVYLYFLDDTVAEEDTPLYNWDYMRLYRDALKSGAPLPGQHQLIALDVDNDGTDWFPSQFGTTYSVPGLADDTSGVLYVWAGVTSPTQDYADFTISIDIWDYNICLNSADYQPGMECRRVVGNDGYTTYLPFWPGERLTISEPRTITETISVASGPIIKTEYIYVPVTNRGTTNVTDNAKTAEKPVETINETSADSVELPLAGDNIQIVEKTIFPWWLVAFLIAGDAIVMWWLLPTKKNRKS